MPQSTCLPSRRTKLGRRLRTSRPMGQASNEATRVCAFGIWKKAYLSRPKFGRAHENVLGTLGPPISYSKASLRTASAIPKMRQTVSDASLQSSPGCHDELVIGE